MPRKKQGKSKQNKGQPGVFISNLLAPHPTTSSANSNNSNNNNSKTSVVKTTATTSDNKSKHEKHDPLVKKSRLSSFEETLIFRTVLELALANLLCDREEATHSEAATMAPPSESPQATSGFSKLISPVQDLGRTLLGFLVGSSQHHSSQQQQQLDKTTRSEAARTSSKRDSIVSTASTGGRQRPPGHPANPSSTPVLVRRPVSRSLESRNSECLVEEEAAPSGLNASVDKPVQPQANQRKKKKGKQNDSEKSSCSSSLPSQHTDNISLPPKSSELHKKSTNKSDNSTTSTSIPSDCLEKKPPLPSRPETRPPEGDKKQSRSSSSRRKRQAAKKNRDKINSSDESLALRQDNEQKTQAEQSFSGGKQKEVAGVEAAMGNIEIPEAGESSGACEIQDSIEKTITEVRKTDKDTSSSHNNHSVTSECVRERGKSLSCHNVMKKDGPVSLSSCDARIARQQKSHDQHIVENPPTELSTKEKLPCEIFRCGDAPSNSAQCSNSGVAAAETKQLNDGCSPSENIPLMSNVEERQVEKTSERPEEGIRTRRREESFPSPTWEPVPSPSSSHLCAGSAAEPSPPSPAPPPSALIENSLHPASTSSPLSSSIRSNIRPIVNIGLPESSQDDDAQTSRLSCDISCQGEEEEVKKKISTTPTDPSAAVGHSGVTTGSNGANSVCDNSLSPAPSTITTPNPPPPQLISNAGIDKKEVSSSVEHDIVPLQTIVNEKTECCVVSVISNQADCDIKQNKAAVVTDDSVEQGPPTSNHQASCSTSEPSSQSGIPIPPPPPPAGFLTDGIKVKKPVTRADFLKEEFLESPKRKKPPPSREELLLSQLEGLDATFASFLKTQLNIKTSSRERGEADTLERRRGRRKKCESECSADSRPGSAQGARAEAPVCKPPLVAGEGVGFEAPVLQPPLSTEGRVGTDSPVATPLSTEKAEQITLSNAVDLEAPSSQPPLSLCANESPSTPNSDKRSDENKQLSNLTEPLLGEPSPAGLGKQSANLELIHPSENTGIECIVDKKEGEKPGQDNLITGDIETGEEARAGTGAVGEVSSQDTASSMSSLTMTQLREPPSAAQFPDNVDATNNNVSDNISSSSSSSDNTCDPSLVSSIPPPPQTVIKHSSSSQTKMGGSQSTEEEEEPPAAEVGADHLSDSFSDDQTCITATSHHHRPDQSQPNLCKSDSGYSGSSPKQTRKKELTIEEAKRLYSRRLEPAGDTSRRTRVQSEGTEYSDYSDTESDLSEMDGRTFLFYIKRC